MLLLVSQVSLIARALRFLFPFSFLFPLSFFSFSETFSPSPSTPIRPRSAPHGTDLGSSLYFLALLVGYSRFVVWFDSFYDFFSLVSVSLGLDLFQPLWFDFSCYLHGGISRSSSLVCCCLKKVGLIVVCSFPLHGEFLWQVLLRLVSSRETIFHLRAQMGGLFWLRTSENNYNFQGPFQIPATSVLAPASSKLLSLGFSFVLGVVRLFTCYVLVLDYYVCFVFDPVTPANGLSCCGGVLSGSFVSVIVISCVVTNAVYNSVLYFIGMFIRQEKGFEGTSQDLEVSSRRVCCLVISMFSSLFLEESFISWFKKNSPRVVDLVSSIQTHPWFRRALRLLFVSLFTGTRFWLRDSGYEIRATAWIRILLNVTCFMCLLCSCPVTSG